MLRRLPMLLGLLTLALAVAAAPALASPSVTGGRWALTTENSVPLKYFQGLTHDSAGAFLFVGIFKGGSRTDASLRELATTDSLIPPAVEHGIGFNHIGDPTYSAAAGGRLLAPLECYYPSGKGDANTCHMGGIGVIDPKTLTWKYWVRLDPADIPKAMWAEVSPDGKRLWTSSGDDLLAYSVADISTAHAAGSATATPIRPVARLKNAVPPSGVTGATFYQGRLLLAGEADGVLQIRSLSVSGRQAPRVEATFPGLQAEPEGLDVVDAGGSLLHFLLSPFGDNGDPTYGSGHSELLGFIPAAARRLHVSLSPATVTAGKRRTVTVTVAQVWGKGPHPVAGATVTAGKLTGTSDAKGRARLTMKPARAGRITVRATMAGLPSGTAALRVRAAR